MKLNWSSRLPWSTQQLSLVVCAVNTTRRLLDRSNVSQTPHSVLKIIIILEIRIYDDILIQFLFLNVFIPKLMDYLKCKNIFKTALIIILALKTLRWCNDIASVHQFYFKKDWPKENINSYCYNWNLKLESILEKSKVEFEVKRRKLLTKH